MNQSDPEVSKRVREILTVLTMGIDYDNDPELAHLVLRFSHGERQVKYSVLAGLLREQQLSLFFDLLAQVESDQDQKYLFNRALNFNNTVKSYGRNGRWDEIELIHQHPISLKHNPAAVAQYHWSAGTLDQLVETLEGEIASAEEDGKKIEQKSLGELIGVLRMQQRFDKARQYIAKIEDDKTRSRFLNRILMEQGDWDAVAGKLAGPDQEPTAENGLIEVTDAQRALVCQFVGDETGYQDVIQKLLKEAEEAKADDDEGRAREILDKVVGVAMVSLDWQLARPHLDTKDIGAVVEMLIKCRRHDEAFELIGLGDDVHWRDIWFDRKMRHVSSMRKKIKRLKKAHEDSSPAVYKLNSTWRMCLGEAGIANTLAGLGLVDEAVAHYHTMFANLSDNSDLQLRSDIVERLFEVGRYEEARRFCEQGFSKSEIEKVASRVVEVQKRTHIRFWMQQLIQRYPNPLKRLHVATGIVNSPFCGLNEFDLRLELASIEPDPKTVKSGLWDSRLAEVHQFHGDEAKYEAHIQMADQAGYRAASSQRIKQAVMSGDSNQIIEYYDSPPNNMSAYAGLLTAEAFRKLGDLPSAALRTASAYAHWDASYSNSSTLHVLAELDKQHLAAEFLKLQVYSDTDSNGLEVSQERYRRSLASSQVKSDPEAAYNDHRIRMFELFANDRYYEEVLDLALETIMHKTALARVRIEQGELDEALDLLLECDRFAPGDPGLGEELIPALDQAGGAEQADRLFEQMSDFYFDLLAKYPESAHHHNDYAWLCACANRRKDHMLRHAKIAVEQRPNSSSFLDTLATVYFLTGEKEKAIDLCRRCIAINPTRQHYRDQLRRFVGDK